MTQTIIHKIRSCRAWQLLPHDFLKWQTIYDYFRAWRKSGLWEQRHITLRERLRGQAGREVEPSASIIDSQSAKTTERGGVHDYDGGKKISGRKRHILVDTLGLMLIAKVHAADILDRNGARLLLELVKQMFTRLSHVWADMGYRDKLIQWIEEQLGWTVEVVQRPRKWVRCPVDEEPPPLPRFTS